MGKNAADMPPSVPVERIERAIHVVRGEKVVLDEDLAALYGVTTKRLNEQVTRNAGRFPSDFSFVLSEKEFARLRSQIATASRAMRRSPPRVFTEHGAVMAACVLNSPVAVETSVLVVRAFARMRELLLTHRDLARRLADLEKTIGRHDAEIRAVFEAIRRLLEQPSPARKGRIGFHAQGS
jgi:hypothetical protein